MSRYITDEDIEAARSYQADEEVTADDDAQPDEPDEGDEGEVGDEPDGQDEEPEDDEAATAEDEDDGTTYELRLGGEVVNLSRKEIEAGLMRQADYTRKTQLLAAERKALADADEIAKALERNPPAAIAALAQFYGVQLGEFDDSEVEPPSKEQQELQELKQWRAQQDAVQREAAVDAEVRRLHEVYGEFDDDDLFTFAVNANVPHLETALRAMTFDLRRNGSPSKQAAKRKVAGVAGGQGHSTAVKQRQEPEQVKSFRDAYEAAKRELDVS